MRRSDYPPPFDQLPAAAAELAMGLGGGAVGPVQAVGFNRQSLGYDWVETVETVGNTLAITLLALADLTAVGSTRGAIMSYGFQGGGLKRGAMMNTSGNNLETAVANASSVYAVATKALGASPTTLGETLYWMRSESSLLSASFGDPVTNAPATAAVSGGNITTATYHAAIFARISDSTNFATAGRGVFAVLSRGVSDAEITALHTGDLRANLVALLKAEVILGNVLWWPVPSDGKVDGDVLPDAADFTDASMNLTHTVNAGTARITADEP